MFRAVRAATLLFIVLATVSGVAFAQSTTGSVFGKVLDSTGGVMPGVTVEISGGGLLKPVAVTTGTSGGYQIPSIPLGVYNVKFTLTGFKTLVRESVRVTTDSNVQIDAKMEIGTIDTQITVTADAPLVDTKSVKTGATFTLDVLQAVPTARDPFQVMNLTPGIIMQTSGDQPGGVNVGGSASGQQMSPSFRGAGSGNTQWNMDGGTITDMAATGAAPIYFDFDAFQEIQVTTGAADASQMTSGININLVTKSGGNIIKGSGHGLFENKALQSQNVTQSIFTRGGSTTSGNPLKMITDDGGEIGGPIKRNKAWFWGAYGYQKISLGILGFFDTARTECNPAPTTFDQLELIQDCLKGDNTWIKNSNAKVNYSLSGKHSFQVLYQNSNKIRDRRNASSTTLPESTVRQYSPGGSWQVNAKHTWIVSDKLVLDNQMLYVHNFFNLDFQDFDAGCTFALGGAFPSGQSCLFNTQVFTDVDTGVTGRSTSASFFARPEWQIKTDGNYFHSNLLGGDHSIKFGVAWRENDSDSYGHTGGFATARYRTVGGVFGPEQARIARDSYTRNVLYTTSIYAQDSYSRGKLRLTAGVRWDYQDDAIRESCVPANPLAPNLLAAQCTSAFDAPIDFSDIAPRLSTTYDLFGNGKTALKASYAMYFAQGVGISGNNSNTGGLTLTYGPKSTTTTPGSVWTDANGDRIAQFSELGCANVNTPAGTTDPAMNCLPSASSTRWNSLTGLLDPQTATSIDPNLMNQRTREVVVGVQHELIKNLGLSVDYIWRNYDRNNRDYVNNQPYPNPSDPFVGPTSFTATAPVGSVIAGQQFTSTYWQLCPTCPQITGPSTTRNSPDYQIFKGVEIAIDKRFSNRWRAQSSVTLSRTNQFNPLGSFADPTNLDKTNGFDGGNSNIRYVFKLNSQIALPFNIMFAEALNVQDGFLRTFVVTGPTRFAGISPTTGASVTQAAPNLEVYPRGTNRYDPVTVLDLGIQRPFAFAGGKAKVTLLFDVFNALNINTIRALQSNYSQTNFDNITAMVAPRVIRLGARVNF